MIHWYYYPRSSKATQLAVRVVRAFETVSREIDSGKHDLASNAVLAKLTPGLQKAGFAVETGKKKAERISVPVLFGLNGKTEKYFDADAHHEGEGFVVEVEAALCANMVETLTPSSLV